MDSVDRRGRRSRRPSARRRGGRCPPEVRSGRHTPKKKKKKKKKKNASGQASVPPATLLCGLGGPAPSADSRAQARVGLSSSEPGEQPVDEAPATRRSTARWPARPPRDDHRVRHVVAPQQLVGAEPQDRPVDGGHPVERPALGVRRRAARRSARRAATTPSTSSTVYSPPAARRRPTRPAQGLERRRPRAARPRTARPARACGPCCGRPRSARDAAEVAAVAGVDLDLLAGGDEQRHRISAPVSRVAGLVPPVDRSPCRPGSV